MALGEAEKSRMARSTAEGACALRARRDDASRSRDPEPGLHGEGLHRARPEADRARQGATAAPPQPAHPRVASCPARSGSSWRGRGTWTTCCSARSRTAPARSCSWARGSTPGATGCATSCAGAALFEVDHPVTAAVKAERLNAIFGEMPGHVNYVHVDFNTQSVGERLAAHGFDPAARSIVLWSGVAPYLEPEGVAQTLRWFASGTSPGSAMCFDYLWQEMLDGDDSFLWSARTAKAGRGGRRAVQVRDPARRHAGVRRRLRPHPGRGPGPGGRARTASSTTPASPTASAAWRSSGTHRR